MKKLVIVSLMLSVVGCATVIDRDFEAEERAYIKKYGEMAAKDPLYQASTPEHVLAADEDGVRVSIHKGVTEIIYRGMPLQEWYAVLVNDNDYPVCVQTQWKLMDFELVTDYPEAILVQANTSIPNYAKLKQTIWNIDGTEFALPPSGYVQSLGVREPKQGGKAGEECMFYDEMEDI
jgi:hypothetical protein